MSGWIDFRCTICGELRRQPLEPLGHEVVNGLCVRCGEVMQLPFRDVPEDAYYYDAAVWGLSHGVVNGTSETTFSPDLSCTRAQAVTFLWRAAGSPEPKGPECRGKIGLSQNRRAFTIYVAMRTVGSHARQFPNRHIQGYIYRHRR